MAKKKWIRGAIKHKGALRKKAESIPGGMMGGKITQMGMMKLSKSKNPTTRKQVNLAKTLRGLKKKFGG